MIEKMWSVSSLVSYIKKGIDHDENLVSLIVQGEISNLVKHRSGHYYFTLKDDKARMSCVMFSNFARLIHFDLQNGSKVIAFCRVSIYEASGSVQLYVNSLQLDGIGDLYLRFEQLKKKLYSEGYFEETHKKQLPVYPMDIAIISANKAAALSDCLTTIQKRWPIAKITFYPSLVQGTGASEQLIQVLQKADKKNHDVILLVRGGGSIEDLWAFNHEELAKCIYHANTPIISGVGHESDTTLVDYVSDARSATPTAAATLATPDIDEVLFNIQRLKKIFIERMKSRLDANHLQLHRYVNHPYFKNPLSYVENNQMSVDLKRNAFEKYTKEMIELQSECQKRKQKIQHLSKTFIQNMNYELLTSKREMIQSIKMIENDTSKEMMKRISLLDAYSPLKILVRGYSLTQKENEYVRNVDDVQINDEIRTIVNDGRIKSIVVSKEKNHE